MEFLSREKVARIKMQYPAGTRLHLLQMNDDVAPVSAGTLGTVDGVDDAGHIHVNWDNGRTLAVIPTVDKFTTYRLVEGELR